MIANAFILGCVLAGVYAIIAWHRRNWGVVKTYGPVTINKRTYKVIMKRTGVWGFSAWEVFCEVMDEEGFSMLEYLESWYSKEHVVGYFAKYVRNLQAGRLPNEYRP